jgi:hypothetical protein
MRAFSFWWYLVKLVLSLQAAIPKSEGYVLNFKIENVPQWEFETSEPVVFKGDRVSLSCTSDYPIQLVYDYGVRFRYIHTNPTAIHPPIQI